VTDQTKYLPPELRKAWELCIQESSLPIFNSQVAKLCEAALEQLVKAKQEAEAKDKSIAWWTTTCEAWKADADNMREQRDAYYDIKEQMSEAYNKEMTTAEATIAELRGALEKILNTYSVSDMRRFARAALAERGGKG
jgi:predicted  nucleic acid-binding Zn-ribbon protein